MLLAFRNAEIAATWATVGFLFARSREEMHRFSPVEKPSYADPALDPYPEAVGSDEADDPFHFAPTLIAAIAATPRQEIASHTFSHYYCLEEGQTKSQFAADLISAKRIAKSFGVDLKTLAFPRNQANSDYLDLIKQEGFIAYRGNQPRWMYQVARGGPSTSVQRGGRFIDSYIGRASSNLLAWSEIQQHNGLCDVRASMFLRPHDPRLPAAENLRLRRITNSMTQAARSGAIFHLWWHPHNFGVRTEENLRFLERIFDHFETLRQRYEFRSMTMLEVAENVSIS